MVWHGMVWYEGAIPWYGMVWYESAIPWYGMAWYGMRMQHGITTPWYDILIMKTLRTTRLDSSSN